MNHIIYLYNLPIIRPSKLNGKRMKNNILFLLLLVIFCYCKNNNDAIDKDTQDTKIPTYRPEIYNQYPHDQAAFTQGLLYTDGFLYESTGKLNSSTLRKIDLESGSIINEYKLAANYFAEGITLYGNKIIQLTWRSKIGFVYDKDSFELIEEFHYPTEGWGITYDGRYLIMSDGSEILYYHDPESFQQIKQITVKENNIPVRRLNELEYIKGNIYANIWGSDRIAIINPQGSVIGWIDLEGILLASECSESIDVLNGIAYDIENNKMYITGKNWCRLFEIELVP